MKDSVESRLGLVERVKLLLARDDFRAHPIKAFSKRLFYRLRWKVTQSPWTLWLHDEFRVDTPKGSPGAYIYYFGASEPKGQQLLKRLLRPGMVFADIGAHLGEYSLVASRIVGQAGAVHAFEPGATVYPFLKRNIEQNFAHNVILHRLAVSDIDGLLPFNIGRDPGHSRVVLNGRGETGISSQGVDSVASARLDSWVLDNEDMHIDVLKVDVEGAELAVLEGAERVLSRAGDNAPVVMFEFLPSTWAVYGNSLDDARRFLGQFGYSVYGYSLAHGPFEVYDDVQAAEASGSLDLILLALKPEHLVYFEEHRLGQVTSR